MVAEIRVGLGGDEVDLGWWSGFGRHFLNKRLIILKAILIPYMFHLRILHIKIQIDPGSFWTDVGATPAAE